MPAGFGEIMGTLARIGFFSTEIHPVLSNGKRATYRTFLCELLKIESKNMAGPMMGEDDIRKRIVELGICKEEGAAVRTAKTIM